MSALVLPLHDWDAILVVLELSVLFALGAFPFLLHLLVGLFRQFVDFLLRLLQVELLFHLDVLLLLPVLFMHFLDLLVQFDRLF